MDTSLKIPFYAKAAMIFITVFALVFTMRLGEEIILPVVYSVIIAILLNPLVNYLILKKVNKLVAISVATVLAVFVVLGIIYIISSQMSALGATYPQLIAKSNALISEFVKWISEKFRIEEFKINAWVANVEKEAVINFQVGDKLTQAGRIIMDAILLPVYVFMILYYKPLLLEFIRKLFRSEHHPAVVEVLINVKRIIQSYLVGLFFELIIVAVMNSAGLLLLGIDYAIILGIIGAVLNIIPYIGGMIAFIPPMIIAFITKDSPTSAILVFCVFTLIQFIDKHYVIPIIVASRVQLNALVSVVVVLIGDAVWGVPGMFVSIPLTAILKVIFDHIEMLKPCGFLLGNIVPTASKFSFIRKKSK